jgi:hypothetical protein
MMDRRAFLALGGSSALGAASRRRTEARTFESVSADSEYRLVTRLDQVDSVLVDREPTPDGRLNLHFVNFNTTPEGDRDVVVVCTHHDPGVHIDGIVRHRTTLWIPAKGVAHLMIDFEQTSNLQLFRHVDRGKEVVLEAVSASAPTIA